MGTTAKRLQTAATASAASAAGTPELATSSPAARTIRRPRGKRVAPYLHGARRAAGAPGEHRGQNGASMSSIHAGTGPAQQEQTRPQ